MSILEANMKSFVQQITKIHQAIILQEKQIEPEPENKLEPHVRPGDQVYVKLFRRKWNNPRREGP